MQPFFIYFSYISTALKKLLSISLTLLLLLSNAGIMYSTHYCYGRKVKSGFTQDKNAMNCLMAYAKDASSPYTRHISFQKKSRCNNEYIFMQTDTAFKKEQLVSSLQTTLFLGIFAYTYYSPYFLQTDEAVNKPYHSPPPIVKSDYQSAHQVYII